MEANLYGKIEEFMTSLDRIKKYKEIAVAMADIAVVLAVTAVVVLTFYILKALVNVFWFEVSINSSGQDGMIVLLIIFLGFIYGAFRANTRVARLPVGQWRSTLNEGAPGAIKLLQELKWESIYSDIRYAKIGFAIYGFTVIFIHYIVAFFVFMFVNGAINAVINVPRDISGLILAVFALVLVLYLDRNYLRKRYAKLGEFDVLLWELRWFDNEFRRADFKT